MFEKGEMVSILKGPDKGKVGIVKSGSRSKGKYYVLDCYIYYIQLECGKLVAVFDELQEKFNVGIEKI